MSWSRTQARSFAAQGATLRREVDGIPFTWRTRPFCGRFSAFRISQEQDSQGGGFQPSATCTLRVDRLHAAERQFKPIIGDLLTRSDTGATLRVADIADSGIAPEIVLTLAAPTA